MRTPIRYGWIIEPVDTRMAPGQAASGNAGGWTPAAEVVETETAYIVELDVPGVRPEDVDLTFEHGELTVAGERTAGVTGGMLRRERPAGAFRRVIRLGDGVSADGIRATAELGVLRIEVPKAEVARPRRIPIDVFSGTAA